MRGATRVIQVCGVAGLIVYPGYGRGDSRI